MIIITGGAGFIGSNLVAALSDRRAGDLIVCDRLGGDDKWRNLAKHDIAGTITPEALPGFLDGRGSAVEAIFHMGAISSTTETNATLIKAENFDTSLNLWRWCAAHDCRFIYASSAATYGDGALGFDDDGAPEALARLRPLNLYGRSKHLFDRRVARLVADGARRPRQWAGLKFFNVYGPNEYHKDAMRSIVAKNHAKAARGEAVTLFKSHHPDYADGGQLRDFISVADCVAVMLWLYDNPEVDGLFNLGTGKARSFADLIAALFAALGRDPVIDYVDTPLEIRDNYQYFTQANMGRLHAAGYHASFLSLEDGVADYVKNYLDKDDPYR